jgi:putative transposase
VEFYHVLNRGVEKRNVVMNDSDRARFLHNLFAFNDRNPAMHPDQPMRAQERMPRSLLVRIHAFCLMENHYHLLLSPAAENGIPFFMKKLNMGYAKYFNEKYSRSGALWQGKYKKKLIERDAHFLYIPYYIHLNPLDYFAPEWREGRVADIKGALAALSRYRWSSHLDYLGKKNFPSITEREELASIIGTKGRYEKEIQSIITNPERAAGSSSIE